MRAIGQLPDQSLARRFGDYLLVEGIPNQVEAEEDGKWTVWVKEDEHLARAQALLEEFRVQPADSKYRKASTGARELREKEQEAEQKWRKRFFERQSLWRGNQVRVGWMTATLAALCVAVAVVKLMQGPDSPLVRALLISEHYPAEGILPEARSGEVWRLVTPIFLHFGVLHLVFNLFWLLDLGSLIEARQNALRLAIKVVGLAAVSNLAQYWVGGPGFGGMSGVVYGLLAYIWMRGKLDPRCGLYIDSGSVTIMVVWFFVCMTGLVGPVANMAHAAGLGLGLAWGFAAARLNR